MPDPIRNDYPTPNLSPEQEVGLDTQSIDQLLAGIPDTQHALPRAENERLTQAAETIGSALGTTVGKVRSGIEVVHDRQREMARTLSEKLAEQKQKVSEQAEAIGARVSEQAGELGDRTQEKAAELLDLTQQRWNDVRDRTREQVTEARRRAAILRDEHPLELIAGFAIAGFVVGVLLRVWRSSND